MLFQYISRNTISNDKNGFGYPLGKAFMRYKEMETSKKKSA
jgi:hypothetical protein